MAVTLAAATASAQPHATEVLVAAAADLARCQPVLSASFAKSGPWHVRFSSGSSGMLARQIENGAPFDLYLSANEAFVNDLARRGLLLPESVVVYARGRLGLWSRSGRIRALEDLLAPAIRHIAIANPAHAPYGVAAQQTLKNRKLWDRLAGRMVLAENVKQALQYAETGNADAALTAWSLVFDRGGYLLPAGLHAPIRQAGAVLKTSRNPRAAAAFLKFLSAGEGREALRRCGFE